MVIMKSKSVAVAVLLAFVALKKVDNCKDRPLLRLELRGRVLIMMMLASRSIQAEM